MPAARASAASASREGGADAAAVLLVGDLERDLGRVAVADEAREARRTRIAVGVGDEHVALGVDAREQLELRRREVRLRAAEAAPPRLGAEALEHGEHGVGVAVAERPDDDAVDVAGLHRSSMRARHGPSRRRRGPSF